MISFIFQKVVLMHLHGGCWITSRLWNDLKTTKKRSLFIKHICRGMWGSKKIANRTLDKRYVQEIAEPPFNSPRKLFTPHKVKAMKGKILHSFLSAHTFHNNFQISQSYVISIIFSSA